MRVHALLTVQCRTELRPLLYMSLSFNALLCCRCSLLSVLIFFRIHCACAHLPPTCLPPPQLPTSCLFIITQGGNEKTRQVLSGPVFRPTDMQYIPLVGSKDVRSSPVKVKFWWNRMDFILSKVVGNLEVKSPARPRI